jgi:hypothetical protein
VNLETQGWNSKNPARSRTLAECLAGRVCKIYTKLPNGEWKFYFQTGALDLTVRK